MATVYTYSITPTTLGCGVTANLSLTIVNSGAAQSGGRQTITIQIPVGTDQNSLTTSISGISVTASTATTQAGWAGIIASGVSGYYLKLQGPPLTAGQVLNFDLNTVVVNTEAGTVQLPVTEQFTNPMGTTSLILQKQFLDLKILSFVPEDAFTSVPGTTNMDWTVQGGSYTVLLPNNVQRPTQGTGPFSDQYPVSITVGPSTQFTLQLWTDNHQYVTENATVYAGTVSATLTNNSLGPIDLTAPVTFNWSSNYAVAPLYLSPTPSGTSKVNTSGSMTFVPGTLLNTNASSLTFTLQATGWPTPAQATTSVFFNPVQILWLRYTDSTKTAVTWGAKNYISRGTSLIQNAGVWTLTAAGPSGPIQQQLGPVSAVQVQLFTASPSSPQIGDTVTLSYETANATGITLNGEATPWDATTQSGSTSFTYAGPSLLTLVATGTGNTSVSSLLQIPY
ncbi:MAG: hypothetical protein ACOVKO_08010 [Elstera sp.]